MFLQTLVSVFTLCCGRTATVNFSNNTLLLCRSSFLFFQTTPTMQVLYPPTREEAYWCRVVFFLWISLVLKMPIWFYYILEKADISAAWYLPNLAAHTTALNTMIQYQGKKSHLSLSGEDHGQISLSSWRQRMAKRRNECVTGKVQGTDVKSTPHSCAAHGLHTEMLFLAKELCLFWLNFKLDYECKNAAG